MKIFLISITVVSSVLMIIVILLQQGKGAELGAAFGRGAQGGLFEASGKANLLSRATSALALVFLMSSLALSLFVGGGEDGVFRQLEGDAGVVESQAADDDTAVELFPDAVDDAAVDAADEDLPAVPADDAPAVPSN